MRARGDVHVQGMCVPGGVHARGRGRACLPRVGVCVPRGVCMLGGVCVR